MKETVYLAGKITGDPFYRMKFYDAARKLEISIHASREGGDVNGEGTLRRDIDFNPRLP